MKQLLIVIIIVAGIVSCKQKDNKKEGGNKIKIGVSMLSLQSEFVVNVRDALEKRALEKNIELIITDAQRTADKQVQQVETFIAQQVDAIILNPCELEASSPAVDKAKAAGIPVINVNSETTSEPDGFVGSKDEESAEIAMEYIAGLLNGKGNIVVMHGYMGQAAQIKRAAGTAKVLTKYPGIKIIAEQTAEWDRAKGMTLMENWIQSYGNSIDAVFAQNDEMGLGAVTALEQAGKKTRVAVVSVDAIADAIKAVKEGRLNATVFQDAGAQGSGAIDMAVEIIGKKKPAANKVFIPFQLVTKKNVDQFIK